MNTRMKAVLATVMLACAASALSASAADQNTFFEQQRQITDGYYPQYNVKPTPARSKPATPHQVAESNWFAAERAWVGTASPQFPVAPAPVASKSRPATTQTAQNSWWQQERDQDDGYKAP
jgi:hypothetical protein